MEGAFEFENELEQPRVDVGLKVGLAWAVVNDESGEMPETADAGAEAGEVEAQRRFRRQRLARRGFSTIEFQPETTHVDLDSPLHDVRHQGALCKNEIGCFGDSGIWRREVLA